MLIGIAYIVAQQVMSPIFSTDYVLTASFASYPLWRQIAYSAVCARVILSKYLGVWLLNEAGCVWSGISYYDGKWDALENVKPALYETVTTLSHCVQSFNINTN